MSLFTRDILLESRLDIEQLWDGLENMTGDIYPDTPGKSKYKITTDRNSGKFRIKPIFDYTRESNGRPEINGTVIYPGSNGPPLIELQFSIVWEEKAIYGAAYFLNTILYIIFLCGFFLSSYRDLYLLLMPLIFLFSAFGIVYGLRLKTSKTVAVLKILLSARQMRYVTVSDQHTFS